MDRKSLVKLRLLGCIKLCQSMYTNLGVEPQSSSSVFGTVGLCFFPVFFSPSNSLKSIMTHIHVKFILGYLRKRQPNSQVR